MTVYDVVASNPAIIGATSGDPTVEASVALAQVKFGPGKVAMLGPVPRLVLGREPLICGMVYVLDTTPGACPSPEDYSVRGVAADTREYSSRLLSGSYYLHLAQWHGQQGDPEGVRLYVAKALAASVDDEATYINGAQVYLKYGMLDEAVKAAEAAVAIDPGFFGGHDLLGGVLLQAGKADLAITEYKKALKGNPSPARVYSNLANAYLSAGDHSAAADDFQKAIELDSTLVNAYVGLGLTLEATGNSERALLLFRKARSIDPYLEPAYHAEASLLLGAGRSEDAVEVARDGLGRWPGNPLLLSDVGLAYLRVGSLDSAIVYLGRAVENDPSLLSARGNLALALERKGLTRQAVEQYRVYLEIAPPGRSRDIAVRALDRLTGTSGP